MSRRAKSRHLSSFKKRHAMRVPGSYVGSNRALSGESTREIRKGTRAHSRHWPGQSWSRLHRRRRISAQYEEGARRRRQCRDLGRSLFLPSAAGGRAAVLGRIFRFIKREGCAFAPQLPARKRNRTMGLLRLRLHEQTRREASPSGQFISGKSSREL